MMAIPSSPFSDTDRVSPESKEDLAEAGSRPQSIDLSWTLSKVTH